MKSITHNIFSAGLGFYLLSRIGIPTFFDFILAVWLSIAINTLIDLGHYWRGAVPTRSFITHSIMTAPLWGGLVGTVSISAPNLALNVGTSSGEIAIGLVLGVVVAYSHLLLDGLTQAGVFFWRHRVAISHFDYDNLGLNLFFAALGVVLLSAPYF